MLNVNTNFSPSVQKQNNPSFGMALYMNEAKIAKEIGQYAADEARKVRPQLEALADKVDVFVNPEVSYIDVGNNCLNISVQDVTQLPKNPKNPIAKYLYQVIICNLPSAKSRVFPSAGDMGNNLVTQVTNSKQIFLQSK